MSLNVAQCPSRSLRAAQCRSMTVSVAQCRARSLSVAKFRSVSLNAAPRRSMTLNDARCSMALNVTQCLSMSRKVAKNTPALRARGLHTRERRSSVIRAAVDSVSKLLGSDVYATIRNVRLLLLLKFFKRSTSACRPLLLCV